IAAPFQPGELLLGTPGYTFGLGFAVRQSDGVAGVAGSAGEFMWAGYAGTYFWVDPKEEIVGVYMSQAPSPNRADDPKMFKRVRSAGAGGLKPLPPAALQTGGPQPPRPRYSTFEGPRVLPRRTRVNPSSAASGGGRCGGARRSSTNSRSKSPVTSAGSV